VELGPQITGFLMGAIDAVILVMSKYRPAKELKDSVWEILLGEPSDMAKPAPLSGEDQHVMKLFWAFTEIHGSIERLKDCETYVSKFPFSRTRVSRSAYLQFVVEGHLHEIYLLRERLVKLAKTAAKLFKRDKKAKQIARSADILVTFVTQGLSGVINVRGAHVHEWRYSHDDIDRLELISTLRKPREAHLPARSFLLSALPTRNLTNDFAAKRDTGIAEHRKLWRGFLGTFAQLCLRRIGRRSSFRVRNKI